MTPEGELRRHFILKAVTETEPYRRPAMRQDRKTTPERNRTEHSATLRTDLEAVADAAREAAEAQSAAGMDRGLGLQVEFLGFPNVALAFESLAREQQGIELLSVRRKGDSTLAAAFVPEGKLVHFEKLISDYVARRRDSIGRARDNRRLIDTIQGIRKATIEALWTDDQDAFPETEDEVLWWEVWLRKGTTAGQSSPTFRELADAAGIKVSPGQLDFPERSVVTARGSLRQFRRSMTLLNGIAELRRAKETAEPFDSAGPEEQAEWLDELLSRTEFPISEDVPFVCLLDTGVNRGHRLLEPVVSSKDLHSVDPAQTGYDTHGHGTRMAGLALAGDLSKVLVDSGPLVLQHRLESVKLLPEGRGPRTGDEYLHGLRTKQAVARAEIHAPFRRRVFGMAITAIDDRDSGRPSAWSAAVDALAIGADESRARGQRRFLAVCAGNVDGWENKSYPEVNEADGIHDPGQSWNALTVGAYTNLVTITEIDGEDYHAVAPAGGLSPFSTTSVPWGGQWPFKPDVVFEGGNAAVDKLGAVDIASLSMLTTHHIPAERTFTTMNMTSAATALACRFAARVMAVYPTLWPETIRALIVHSAEWTDQMRAMHIPTGRLAKKQDYAGLLRRCGFGVPDLGRALWSVSNSLAMVLEGQIQPYRKRPGREPVLNEMNLHSLPWPTDALLELGDETVEMRVTLSYFIEPNPSRRGRSRYRYESHGLRFDVIRSYETREQFRRRVNQAAREEGYISEAGSDDGWLIGTRARTRGSVHADIWCGSAADLAQRSCIAIVPTAGWWKTRKALKRFESVARYVLVVSIRAPEQNVDLYSEVATRIKATIEVES